MTRKIQVQHIGIGNNRPVVLIAGPCVIESEASTLDAAERLKKITTDLGVPFIFKSSYDKANRSSLKSYRGPGLKEGLRILGRIRKELGVPTTFNFLGPLANPARVKRQVIGVSDETMATRMLGVLRLLGTEQAMVFHGDDGLDELTTSTTSTVHELVHGEVHTFTFDPLDLGIPRAAADTLVGGDAEANADAIRAVLGGEKGAHRDIAVLNAAAALVVAGLAPDLGSGVESAGAAIDDGRAAQALEKLVDVSTVARASEGS